MIPLEDTPLVEMRDIEKSYGRVQALEGVDFHVNHGEVVGLVGDNGAGKSTLIKILCGIENADVGSITFEGDDVSFSSPKQAMARGIETIHQDTALVEDMDIKRNLFLGKEPSKELGPIHWLDLGRMARESVQALKDVGLELRSHNVNVSQLSGGQRQGVAIARALHFDAKLLILDEPTNNLSVKESRKVYRFVEELRAEGVSSIFISHNINAVYPVADRVVVLRLGKKITDTPKEDTSIETLIDQISV